MYSGQNKVDYENGALDENENYRHTSKKIRADLDYLSAVCELLTQKKYLQNIPR